MDDISKRFAPLRIILARPGGRRNAFVVVTLGFLVVLAYYPSLSGEFVFDDRASITDNPAIRTLWPLAVPLSPPATAGVGGRPLLNLSFALNYALSGLEPWSYHLANVALHAANALLAFALTRRTLLLPRPAVTLDSAGQLAFLVALIWALLPVATQAVSYISQRAELAVAACLLSSLYCFLRYAETSRGSWRVATVLFTAAGMLMKEVMVAAPVLILLYDRTFIAGSFRAAWTSRRTLYMSLSACWLLLAPSMLSLDERGVGLDLGVGQLDYLATQAHAVSLYVLRVIWPHPLVFDYGVRLIPWFDSAVPVALTVALVWAIAYAMKQYPRVGYCGFWALALLAPSSSVIPIVHQPMAESRIYLASLAVVALAICGFATFTGVSRRIWLPAAAAFALITIARNHVYRSEEALWADTIIRRPDNPRAYYNLGVRLERQRRWDEALERYRQALVLAPGYPDALNNAGHVLLRLGRPPEAAEMLTAALRVRPDYEDAHVNLGAALARLGRPDDALDQFERALQLNPRNPNALNNAGIALDALGRHADARTRFAAAIAIDPSQAEFHYNSGNNLLRLGAPAEGAEAFRNAIARDPTNAAAHANLGFALLNSGRPQEALAPLETSARLHASAETQNNLAAALFQLGRIGDAVRACEAALSIDPANQAAQDNLARLRRLRPPSQR